MISSGAGWYGSKAHGTGSATARTPVLRWRATYGSHPSVDIHTRRAGASTLRSIDQCTGTATLYNPKRGWHRSLGSCTITSMTSPRPARWLIARANGTFIDRHP